MALLSLFVIVACKRPEPAAPPAPVAPARPVGPMALLAGFDPAAEAQRLQGTWRDRSGCFERFDGSLHSEWCGSDAPVVRRFRVRFPSRLAFTHVEADGGDGTTFESGYALEPEGLRRWHSYSGTTLAAGVVVPTFWPRGLIVAGEKECLFYRALSLLDPERGFASAGQHTACAWDTADGGRALTVALPQDDEGRSIRLVQVGASLMPEVALPGVMVRQE